MGTDGEDEEGPAFPADPKSWGEPAAGKLERPDLIHHNHFRFSRGLLEDGVSEIQSSLGKEKAAEPENLPLALSPRGRGNPCGIRS
jgi:hypothetical protein